MKKQLLFLLLSFTFWTTAKAVVPFAKWDSTKLTLNNGLVIRTILLPGRNGGCFTTKYQPIIGGFKYFKNSSPEFEFDFNSKHYSGTEGWNLIIVQEFRDTNGGNGASIVLSDVDRTVQLTINYLLYQGSPAIRKNLIIKNISDKQASLESVDVEKFDITEYYAPSFSWILSDYGRRKSLGPFLGGIQDALVIVHNTLWNQGIVIGNEASGVMKRTSALIEGLNISTGLTHRTDNYPFRKWLKPGESFATPQVFTIVYNEVKNPNDVLNTLVPDFVRKNMGIRLSLLKTKPTFVYNTWSPFGTNINEKLVMELAQAAAKAGMKEFVIDDGWQDEYGDWNINQKKFPHGLKPVFDYIKSLGMKPGLWVSIGTAAPASQVFKQHPEWFVKNKEGKPYSLVIEDTTKSKYTACFGTGWSGYIKSVLTRLVNEYGLEYLKLDFSVVTSPYRYRYDESGCYATDHPGHKDQHESLYTNYEPMWQLFDDLHRQKPLLFIDCTFETLGGLQTIDYALLKHAEGDWISNYDHPNQDGDLQIRNLSWWRSPTMSASALVIGNPKMNDTGWEMHIKSLAGGLPIMLGDPRKLNDRELKVYRQYSDWLILMQQKYDIMSFRQDIAGLGEPAEGMWDGFQRINTDSKKGGIVGVFKQGSVENERFISVSYLDKTKNYCVKSINGEVLGKFTGLELLTRGFKVAFKKSYDGQLFEIGIIP